MAISQPPPFAPTWLKCAVCALLVLQFPIVSIVALLWSAGYFILPVLAMSGSLSFLGVRAIIHGDVPASPWRQAIHSLAGKCRFH